MSLHLAHPGGGEDILLPLLALNICKVYSIKLPNMNVIPRNTEHRGTAIYCFFPCPNCLLCTGIQSGVVEVSIRILRPE